MESVASASSERTIKSQSAASRSSASEAAGQLVTFQPNFLSMSLENDANNNVYWVILAGANESG